MLKRKNGLLAQILKDGGPSSKIREMTLDQMLECMREMGLTHLNQYFKKYDCYLDIFLNDKEQALFKDEDKELMKIKFMNKYRLNKKDMETLKLCSEGLTNDQIAERSGVTVEAIKKRIEKMRERMGTLKNKPALVAKAKEEGVI